MVATIESYYNATHVAKIIGCSRSSVCRAAKNNNVGIFTNGRLAALTKADISVIRDRVHDTPGNPLWIAARGQKVPKRKKLRKGI